MPFDLAQEGLIALMDVPDHAPLAGHKGKFNIATIHRWAKKGVKGIKLEFLSIGRKRYTSQKALNRFFVRVAAVEQGEPDPFSTPTRPRRAAAGAQLAAMEA